MDMFLHANEQNITRVIEQFEYLQSNTGFKINYDKTKLYPIGEIENQPDVVPNTQIKCTAEPINVLGVWIDYKEEVTQELNYAPLIEKTKQILNSWKIEI